jgi:hypothetical protein
VDVSSHDERCPVPFEHGDEVLGVLERWRIYGRGQLRTRVRKDGTGPRQVVVNGDQRVIDGRELRIEPIERLGREPPCVRICERLARRLVTVEREQVDTADAFVYGSSDGVYWSSKA